jgi:hypothetical protein
MLISDSDDWVDLEVCGISFQVRPDEMPRIAFS